MKILSYNTFGFTGTMSPIPNWEVRKRNVEKILNQELKDEEVMLCCFQEVTQNNIDFLNDILEHNGFEMLEKFPMITQSIHQYNIVAIKKSEKIRLNFVHCVPHGKDEEYQSLSNQKIDYGMTDYRTSVFVSFIYHNCSYLIGNTHTDCSSIKGKIKGIIKSLNYMDSVKSDFKVLIGDMNMVSHMSEVHYILNQKHNYTTLSRNEKFQVEDNSWHGYGTMEQVNIDFAFVESEKISSYDYEIIKQANMMNEGSDHRPIIITIH